MPERQRSDPRPTKKARNPAIDRQIEFDVALVDQERNFPDADRAQIDGSAPVPAFVNDCARGSPELVTTTVQPESDMSVEEEPLAHRRSSRPVAASGVSLNTGPIKSTPDRTRTEPA